MLGIILLLGACATLPPSHPDDLCRIFQEKKNWYRDAKAASERWKIPIPILMATMRTESGYRAKAKPARPYYLGFIPGVRPSNAYGYAQAKDDTWQVYRHDAGHDFASRDDFADAVDFMGWYDHGSVMRNHIAPGDAYHLYLSYHEGQGGYARHTYAGKSWLLAIARHVETTSHRYAAQLAGCIADLESSQHHWF
ncbi:MAG: hypothetical protein HKM02_03770 [Pseudomonadales bacterium]|nr:hypothetical protein [Pseudomonadales bacterium]